MQYQYTIKGNIIQGPGIDDSAGYLAQLGLAVGSPVKYMFTINLSAPGFIKMTDGTIKPATQANSFYVKYISGTTWTPTTHISSYNNIAEQNYGNSIWQNLYPLAGERYIFTGNGNNYLNISDMWQLPDPKDRWPVGSRIGGSPAMQNILYDASGKRTSFYFDAIISRAVFTPAPPV